eukprot:2885307-Rhodomonas_salina.2
MELHRNRARTRLPSGRMSSFCQRKGRLLVVLMRAYKVCLPLKRYNRPKLLQSESHTSIETSRHIDTSLSTSRDSERPPGPPPTPHWHPRVPARPAARAGATLATCNHDSVNRRIMMGRGRRASGCRRRPRAGPGKT